MGHPRLSFGLRGVGFCTLCIALPLPASAALINGSFERALFGWETLGDASVQDSSFGADPTDGRYQALITSFCDDGVNCDSNFDTPFSDSSAITIEPLLGGSLDTLLDFLLIDSLGDLDIVGEVSAIRQTFTAPAGSWLSFDFKYATTDGGPDPALATLVGAGLSTTQILVGKPRVPPPAQIGYIEVPFAPDPSPSQIDLARCVDYGPCSTYTESNYTTYSFLIPTTGTYTLGFAVANMADTTLPAVLLIDDVRLQVPEPGSLPLFAGGLIVGTLLVRRKGAPVKAAS